MRWVNIGAELVITVKEREHAILMDGAKEGLSVRNSICVMSKNQ